jgi:hypothetical protein
MLQAAHVSNQVGRIARFLPDLCTAPGAFACRAAGTEITVFAVPNACPWPGIMWQSVRLTDPALTRHKAARQAI